MGTVLALGLLVGICGFIAYSGDLLGRRLGKRRLTLWGLRPRHTAIVCTVFTGMLIAGVSLAAMIGLSVGVRRAVIHGEALLRENWLLKRDNRRQTQLGRELQAQTAAQSTQIAEQTLQIAEQNRRLADQGERNRKLATAKGVLERRLDEDRSLNEALEASGKALEARIKRLEGNQRQLLERNDGLRRKMVYTQRRLHGVQRQLTAARGALKKTRTALLTERATLDYVRKQNEIVVAAAMQKIDSLRANRRALAEDKLVARADEELARTEIPPGATDTVIRDAVGALVRRTESEVAGRYRAAAAAHPPREAITLQPSWARPSDIVNGYVSLIGAQGQGVVVRTFVRENTTLGAAVPVRIVCKSNRLAFRKGEEVAAILVDGQQTEGALLRRLLSFLQGQVRERALRCGVLPTTDGRVGEIQYDPLLETVKKIREIGGPARVGAVASNDVWSVGPLGIDFYVLPGENHVADGPR